MATTADHIPSRTASRPPPTRVERLRVAASGVAAGVLGLLPHVLHHAGPLAGAALLAGVGGSLLFGALGFLAAIPLLLRLRRRFGGWQVPAAALAFMVTVFAISTFIVGPAITGSGDSDGSAKSRPQTPQEPAPGSGHEGHH